VRGTTYSSYGGVASFTYVCDKERSVGLKRQGRSAVAPERGDEDASYVKRKRGLQLRLYREESLLPS